MHRFSVTTDSVCFGAFRNNRLLSWCDSGEAIIIYPQSVDSESDRSHQSISETLSRWLPPYCTHLVSAAARRLRQCMLGSALRVCVYVCVWGGGGGERQTDRQTEGDTQRDWEKHTHTKRRRQRLTVCVCVWERERELGRPGESNRLYVRHKQWAEYTEATVIIKGLDLNRKSKREKKKKKNWEKGVVGGQGCTIGINNIKKNKQQQWVTNCWVGEEKRRKRKGGLGRKRTKGHLY